MARFERGRVTPTKRPIERIFLGAFIAITVMTLGACGAANRFNIPSGTVTSEDRAATTGAVNDDGHPYTAFTATADVESLKAQVGDLDYNAEFGGQILTVTVVPAQPSTAASASQPQQTPPPLQIAVNWKNMDTPLMFQGQVAQSGTDFYSTLTETSGQRPDLQMTADCADVQCNNGSFLVFDGDNHKAGIIISKEDRVIKLKATSDDSQADQGSNQASNQVIDEYKSGQPVVVTSTQIIPGHSYFELQQKQTDNSQGALDIKGDLIEPDGTCPDLQVTDPTQKLGQACLLGNDEEGSIVIRAVPLDASVNISGTNQPQIQTQDQPPESSSTSMAKPAPEPAPTTNNSKTKPTTTPPAKNPTAPVTKTSPAKKQAPIYLELLPRGSSSTSGTSSSQGQTTAPQQSTTNGSHNPDCPITVSTDSNPLIQKIMADCGNPKVTEYINNVWGPNAKGIGKYIGSRKGNLPEFLGLYAESKTDHPSQRALQFKQMLQTLASKNYPQIMSFVTLQESDFISTKVGSSGEHGVWQFMPDTAKFVSLPWPQVTQIVPATQGFVRDFDYLLNYWNGDFKMALSSYNRGAGGLQYANDSMVKRWQDDPNIPVHEKEAYTKFGFWYLYDYYMIQQPTGNWGYVPSVLAAIFVGVSPESYGIQGVTGMELK